MISRVIVLVGVTHIISDGRITTEETAQPSMEECYRLAEIVNNANGKGKYEFFAWCREDQLNYLAKVE